jgi:hypothetical protein
MKNSKIMEQKEYFDGHQKVLMFEINYTYSKH